MTITTQSRRIIRLLPLFCLMLSACAPLVRAPSPNTQAISEIGAAGLGDPIYPHLGNGGYDVTHYAIDLAVDMASDTIRGTTIIQAEAIQPVHVQPSEHF